MTIRVPPSGDATPVAAASRLTIDIKAAPFNAKVDGAYRRGTIAGGALSTLTMAGLTSADAGKLVLIEGAGPSGQILSTTFSAAGTGSATLATPASQGVTNKIVHYGTDDTAAVLAAMEYIYDHDRVGEITCPDGGISMIGGALRTAPTRRTPTGWSGFAVIAYNAQLPIPFADLATDDKMVIKFRGPCPVAAYPGYGGYFGNLSNPRTSKRWVLLSTLTGASYGSPNPGTPCMLGGPEDAGTGANSFTNTLLVLDGVEFRVPTNPSVVAVDARRVATLQAPDSAFSVTCGVPAEADEPTHPTGQALLCPIINCNAPSTIGRFVASGFYAGLSPGEHLVIENAVAVMCKLAWSLQKTGHSWHAIRLLREGCTYGFGYAHPQTGIGPVVGCEFEVEREDIEDVAVSPAWITAVYDFWDGVGNLATLARGTIKYLKKYGTNTDLPWNVHGEAAEVTDVNLGALIYPVGSRVSLPKFPNGWLPSTASGIKSSVGFRKLPDGDVVLEGKITGGVAGAPAFVLPPRFRPRHAYPDTLVFPQGVTIDVDGNVTPTTSNTTSLEGIRFRCASVRRSGQGPELPGPLYEAPVAGFNPATAFGASLAAWYKADVGTDTTTEDATIAQWDDQSGNARHLTQGTAGNRPVYKANIQNGLPAVWCNGDWMSAVFTLPQPSYLFIVAKILTVAAQKYLADGGGAFTNLLQLNGSANFDLYAGAGGVSFSTPRIGGPQSGSVIDWSIARAIGGLANGASSELRVDGSWVATGNAGTTAAGGVTIGAGGAGANPINAYFHEVIVLNRAPTAPESANLFGYARTRWATR